MGNARACRPVRTMCYPLTLDDLSVSFAATMSPRRASLSSFPRNALVALCTLLVIALAILAASPAAHRWLHAGSPHADHGHPAATADRAEHDCPVTLFAHGVPVPAPPAVLEPQPCVLEVLPSAARTEQLWLAPRYLHQPERAPPANRIG